MKEELTQIRSSLFAGIAGDDLLGVLGCVGYHIRSFQKGEVIAFDREPMRYVGVVLRGAVDMVKEDVWGNRSLLLRCRVDDVFGETFACGTDDISSVSFLAAEESRVLFLSFGRVMRTCSHACEHHQKLVENMVRVIADKNRELMQKVEIISKKSLREKILSYLSHYAQRSASSEFEIPLGRIELADYLCADRSALTRELAKMREEGLVEFDKNRFRLLS